MARFPGTGLGIALAAALALGATGAAHAAGALAIGACEHFGYATKFATAQEAGVAAIGYCQQSGDETCVVRLTVQGNCFAFAVDKDNLCGARGFAYGESESEAQSLAVNECVRYGGKDCVPKMSACDR